jgi:2-polyprenyl-3-methyl-5-hydroxy-6-metoxy-1,4-benzoquinol methylase
LANSREEVINGVKKFYKAVSSVYLDIYPKLAELEEEHAKQVIECIGNRIKGKKILDCACGIGYLVKAFSDKGYDAYGSDLSVDQIGRARKINRKLKRKYCVCDWKDLGRHFRGGNFDIVLCLGPSIQEAHPQHVKSNLKNMLKVLSSGGILIIETIRDYNRYLRPNQLIRPRGCAVRTKTNVKKEIKINLIIDHDVKKYSYTRDVIQLVYELINGDILQPDRLPLRHSYKCFKISKEFLRNRLTELGCEIIAQKNSLKHSCMIFAKKHEVKSNTYPTSS